MDHATRKRLYNRLNPHEPLEPTDPRNVDIDKLPGNVRGGNFVENLERKVLFSEIPGCTFVTAQRGAGLTTELRRLGAKLSAPDGARLLVVHVEAQDVVDLSRPLQSADLLFAIWAQTEQLVANTVGKRMSDHARGFWKWLTQTEIHVAELSLPGASATITWEPRTLEAMRARFEVDRFRILNEIRSEMVLLQDTVKQAGYGGIVVIVDGLNRLRGLSTNWREVLDRAERAIGHELPQWHLPVPVVMTAPSVLLLRPSMHVEFLSYLPIAMVQQAIIITKPEVAFAAGDIFESRISGTDFEQILGSKVAAERIRRLIGMSAGCIGDMLRLLRECVLVDQMDEATFNRVISQFNDRWRRMATQDMLRALAEVHRTGRLDSMNRAMAEEAMVSTFVVRDEPDGRIRVHPALHARLPDLSRDA